MTALRVAMRRATHQIFDTPRVVDDPVVLPIVGHRIVEQLKADSDEFEVDHRDTQAWKRSLLTASGVAIPPCVTFAPVDFERQTISERLEHAGIRRSAITFFSWLGVTPYLTKEAMSKTLAFVASMPERSGVVFDYAVPRASLNELGQQAFDRLASRVAAAGEPFRLFLAPEDIAMQLKSLGFRTVEDLGAEKINSRYFEDRSDGLRVRGQLGRLISSIV